MRSASYSRSVRFIRCCVVYRSSIEWAQQDERGSYSKQVQYRNTSPQIRCYVMLFAQCCDL
jgi:hypothetical protein